MPSTATLLAFAATAFLVIVVPGPSVLFVVGRGIAYGRKTAVLSAAGNALGSVLLAVVVAVGLGVLVAQFGALLTAVKLIGAAYLVYLGVQTIRHRRTLAADQSGQPAVRGGWRAVWDGAVVGATNPKTLVFFLAALPQFTDPAAGSIALQLLIFGTLLIAIGFSSDCCYAILAGTMRRWFLRTPRRISATGITSGSLMIGLGASFALAGGTANT